MTAAWIVGYAVIAPLYHAGVSHPVWGLYPASAPLLIIGLASAAAAAAFRVLAAGRASALAIAVVAAAPRLGSPAGSSLIPATASALSPRTLSLTAYTSLAQRAPACVRP